VSVPREVIEQVRENTDLVELIGRHVSLKARGGRYLGLCPFHQEKTPSFNVIPTKGIYYCFGCQASGDAFKFLQLHQGLSFMQALKELAGAAGVTIEERELTPQQLQDMRAKSTLRDACEVAAAWFHGQLMTGSEGHEARKYLADRGITTETITKFRLGWAPDSWTGLMDHLHSRGVSPDMAVEAGLAKVNERRNSRYDAFRGRVIVPIMDSQERPIAFGGRILVGDGPKYINSTETEIYKKSSTLYNLSRARPAIQRNKRVILVEGYFDVISLAQAGWPETVATCGTALTQQHLHVMRRLTNRAYALFDADEAGARAAAKSLPLFLQGDIEALRIELPGAKDPDELVREQGAEAFERTLGRARPLLSVVLERIQKRNGLTPGGRSRSVEEALPLLRLLRGPSRDTALAGTAGLLGVSEEALRRAAAGSAQERDALTAGGHQGARWIGNVELNHLIWLTLHHPDETAPALAQVDPALVTDRQDVAWAIGQLLSGSPLPTVLETLDADVARVFQAAAAREGLYVDEQVAGALRDIVARLQHRSLQAQLVAVRRQLEDALSQEGIEISGCEDQASRKEYFVLLTKRVELQRQLEALKRQSKANRS
jgi:DNA primase